MLLTARPFSPQPYRFKLDVYDNIRVLHTCVPRVPGAPDQPWDALELEFWMVLS